MWSGILQLFVWTLLTDNQPEIHSIFTYLPVYNRSVLICLINTYHHAHACLIYCITPTVHAWGHSYINRKYYSYHLFIAIISRKCTEPLQQNLPWNPGQGHYRLHIASNHSFCHNMLLLLHRDIETDMHETRVCIQLVYKEVWPFDIVDLACQSSYK